MKLIRYVTTVFLRLVLRFPLSLLGAVCGMLAAAFEIAEGKLEDMDRMLRQITELPYVTEWNRLLAKQKEDDRYRLLQRMRESAGESRWDEPPQKDQAGGVSDAR